MGNEAHGNRRTRLVQVVTNPWLVNRWQRIHRNGEEAGRMAKSAGTDSGAAIGIGRNVKNYIIGTLRVPGDSPDRSQLVESQAVADTPGDIVVGTGRVTTDTHATNLDPAIIEREPTAKNVYAADAMADHRIVRCPE
jgi:hypothetical protein